MDESKQKGSLYSGERTELATLDKPPEVKKPEGPSGSAASAEPPKQAQAKPPQARETTPLAGFAKPGETAAFAELWEFLKQTRTVWLIVAGGIFGVMAVVTVTQRVSEWARNTREKRHEEAVATLSPETLITRCGAPAEDMTKDLYPILMRTMRYQRTGKGTLMIAFSRTAEEKSNWVFLSMKDESGGGSYDTPETKIAALPCLAWEK